MVHLVSEVVERNQRILILEQYASRVSDALKRKFHNAETELFVSAQPPNRLDQFDYIFACNIDYAEELLKSSTKTLIVVIFAGMPIPQTAKAAINKVSQKSQRKIIELSADFVGEPDIERILWFAFSKSKEDILSLVTAVPKSLNVAASSNTLPHISDVVRNITFKRFLITLLCLVLIILLIPIPLIGISLIDSKSALKEIQNGNVTAAQIKMNKAHGATLRAQQLYNPIRPVYLLFSLAGMPDGIIAFNSQAYDYWNAYNVYASDLNSLLPRLFFHSPSQTNGDFLKDTITKLTTSTASLNAAALSLREKLTSTIYGSSELIDSLNEISITAEKTMKIAPSFIDLLGNGEDKSYLLLIANDQNLRPGGGSIEAYGWITLNSNSIADIHIENAKTNELVPSATVEVPSVFTRYANIKDLSLADAAYSAHFPDNYARIRLMLEEGKRDKNFAGSILVTRTGISQIIKSSGSIYLPRLKEKVSAENVAIKADIYRGDMRFYQEVFDVLRGSLRNGEAAPTFFNTIMRLLDEKQILVLFNDQKIQSPFESLYWTGRIITPECVVDQQNCIVDSLFPLETNLGQNNINPYIVKHTTHKAIIKSDGSVAESVDIQLRNTASTNIQPSSLYKTYLQLLLPPDITISSITRNNVLIENVDSLSSQLTILGMYLSLKPQEQATVHVTYKLNKKIDIAKGTYQVVVQKQTGSANSDFSFELALPHNLEATRYNFAPVVNGSKLNYNTLLNSDKVFLIEFKKR